MVDRAVVCGVRLLFGRFADRGGKVGGMTQDKGREALERIGSALAELREQPESAVVISFGTVGPSHDCPNGHFLVTVEKSGERATAEAVHVQDALLLARAKVNAQLERREKERKENHKGPST